MIALEPGERVVWTGRPSARIPLVAVPGLIVGLGVTALSLLFATAGGIGFLLFGLAFAAVGLWVLSLPFAWLRRTRRTNYVLADRRFIVGDAAYRLDTLRGTARLEARDGSGELHLDFEAEGVDVTGLVDVRRVETLIADQRRLK